MSKGMRHRIPNLLLPHAVHSSIADFGEPSWLLLCSDIVEASCFHLCISVLHHPAHQQR